MKLTHLRRIKRKGISDVRNAFFSSWPLTGQVNRLRKMPSKIPGKPRSEYICQSCSAFYCTRHFGKNRTLRPSKDHSNSKELKASDDLVLIDGDISKKETAIEVAEAAIKHFGRIDLLVNNAGIFIPKSRSPSTPRTTTI
jgi:hypothetical protein